MLVETKDGSHHSPVSPFSRRARPDYRDRARTQSAKRGLGGSDSRVRLCAHEAATPGGRRQFKPGVDERMMVGSCRRRSRGAPKVAAMVFGLLAAAMGSAVAQQSAAPADVVAAIDAAIDAGRRAGDDAALVANIINDAVRTQVAQQTGARVTESSVALAVVEGIARYPQAASAIVRAAVERVPQHRAAIAYQASLAFPRFAPQIGAAAGVPLAPAAPPPAPYVSPISYTAPPPYAAPEPQPVPLREPAPRLGLLDGVELGVRTVMTTGQTDWNHDASGADPTLGNPTSELIYEDVSVFALEFNGYVPLPKKYFVRGNVGLGIASIGDGNLRDDDFSAGQVLSSSTDSVIPDTDLFYLTVDIGREVVRFRNDKGSLSLFAGFQYWTEEYEAFGVFDRLAGGQTVSENTLVIRNEVEWTSFRLGAMGSYRMNNQVTWLADLAFIPYTDMHNEDSHVLRQSLADLGPVPNVIMDGEGFGFQGEIGVAYQFAPSWNASLGFQYWTMMSDGDVTLGPNSTTPATFPLNDLDTYRYGVTAEITYKF